MFLETLGSIKPYATEYINIEIKTPSKLTLFVSKIFISIYSFVLAYAPVRGTRNEM